MTVGDWVVFDMEIGQIKDLRDDGIAFFIDGFCETSGRITDRFRPLTIKNKRIVETIRTYYERLREINGEAGFNYPDISRYFSQLVLDAIDNDSPDESFKRAERFVRAARDYEPNIHGISLFRRA